MKKNTFSKKNIVHFLSSPIFILILILPLSAFYHLWNPSGFPYGPSHDESIYMRRTMNVLEGQGPQESLLYDHPYFAQIFLASIFGIVGYPDSLHLSANYDIHSIEMLWLVPRVLMGLLAVIDTFLVYKIAERRYNKTIAIIASILFVVTPTTWMLRRVWLESIQLPFLLCSILFAIYSKRISSFDGKEEKKDKQQNKNKLHILLVFLSGIFLGLAIFTKIPIFTMIPLVGFLIYTNNKSLKVLGLWFIPVILIPLIWPIYAISIDEFNFWLDGIYFQTHRGVQSLFVAIEYNFKTNSITIFLGIIGILIAAIKKDIFPLLWTVPFLVFLYFAGFVSFWHLIPLFPIFCIASSIVIEKLWKKINVKKIKHILLFSIILGGFFVGMLYLTVKMITSDNSIHYKAVAFVSQYLQNNIDYKNKIILISNPFYSWIPKYVFHLNNYQIIDYYDNIPIKAERVLFITDSQWEKTMSGNFSHNMKENFKLYSKNEIANFDDLEYNISIYEYNLPIHNKTKSEKTLEFINNLVKYNNITSPNK